jgi:hypothetical protein
VSAKKAILVLCGVVLVLIVAFVVLKSPSSPKNQALADRELVMESLGKTIARLRPKSKALVLSNPFAKNAGYLDETSQYERAGLRGLRKGLGGDITVTLAAPNLRADFLADQSSVAIPPDSRTPLSFMIDPAAVDQLASAHPECQVIVSLIGLPLGVEGLKIWDEKDPHCFAMLLPDMRVLGPPEKTFDGFQRGKLLAAVAQDEKSGDPLIVTRENIQAVLATQPKALGY